MGNTFIINKNKIIENYKKFKKIGPVFYPLKTNSDEIIINILKDVFDVNDKFAISNKKHFKVLENLQIASENIVLINPLFNIEDLEWFYSNGIRDFVFDDINVFLNFSAKHNDIISSVRLNIKEIYDCNNSFIGASFSDALNMISSGCSLSIYCPQELRKDVEYLDDILTFIKVVNPKSARLGGFRTDIDFDMLQEFNLDNGIDLIAITGSALLKDAIELKCDIIKIKDNFIIINSSIYTGFKYLCDKNFNFYTNVESTNNNKKYIICGNSSDSEDIFGFIYLDENKINEYTVLTIKNVGAYFKIFSENFDETIEKEIA